MEEQRRRKSGPASRSLRAINANIKKAVVALLTKESDFRRLVVEVALYCSALKKMPGVSVPSASMVKQTADWLKIFFGIAVHEQEFHNGFQNVVELFEAKNINLYLEVGGNCIINSIASNHHKSDDFLEVVKLQASKETLTQQLNAI